LSYAIAQGRGNHDGARSRSPSNWEALSWQEQPKGYKGDKGNGKGKGKKGGKGNGGRKGDKGNGKGKVQWHSKTPDGRSICFGYSKPEGCPGYCGMVHCCRRCFGPHTTEGHDAATAGNPGASN